MGEIRRLHWETTPRKVPINPIRPIPPLSSHAPLRLLHNTHVWAAEGIERDGGVGNLKWRCQRVGEGGGLGLSRDRENGFHLRNEIIDCRGPFFLSSFLMDPLSLSLSASRRRRFKFLSTPIRRCRISHPPYPPRPPPFRLTTLDSLLRRPRRFHPSILPRHVTAKRRWRSD